MKKPRKKSIATHEAGHFVMRWFTETPPTGCAVFSKLTADGTGGISYGTLGTIPADRNALITAAGFAANYAFTWGYSYLVTLLQISNVLKDINTLSKENEDGDFSILWASTFQDRQIFANTMIHAFAIMRKLRRKVMQIRDLLMERGRITKREAARIFAQWGKPPTWDIYHGLSKASKDALATVAKGLDGE